MLIRTKLAIAFTLLSIGLIYLVEWMVQSYDLHNAPGILNLPIWLILLIGVASFTVSSALSYVLLSPLYKVINEMKAFDPNDIKKRLNSRINNDAVKWLTDSFNLLLNKIQTSFDNQQMFIFNVSHEVKNPLSSMSTQIDVALAKERTNKEYQLVLNSIKEEIEGLTQVTNNLLQLSQILNDKEQFKRSPFLIDEMLWSVKKSIEQQSPERSITLHIQELPNDPIHLSVVANETLIRIAIENLIINACKFSPDRTANVVLTFNQFDLPCVSVSDEGPGISAKDQKQMFELFYRSETTKYVGGNGIGLPLVKKIIDLHNYLLEVKSSEEGTTMSIVFQSEA